MWSEYNEAEDYLNFLIANKSERPDNFDFAAVRKGAFHTYYKSTTQITPKAWDLIERIRRVGIQLTSREQMNTDKRLLGKFVSSAVINVVKDKRAFERAMAGEKREMTILFASLKTSSNSEAEAFIEELAFHLKSCQEAIRQTAGVINKVMENKILVFFDHEACNSAENAVKQAIATVGALKQNLRAQNHSGYYGLATGAVVAGILGARNLRLDYTVIGDAVNLSARLNALAADDSGSQIIIDEKTRALLSNKAAAESLGEINIKGKTAPMTIYRI